ncbi:MAG: hypothetical protein HeimC3_46910 [Candidatus Heimdallarchaeota archaeon LC_3]|nr:MAG: hypothetical protein HeimC3_46910 [Candidatus Heimdallarchaeota archaeon LC_3]
MDKSNLFKRWNKEREFNQMLEISFQTESEPARIREIRSFTKLIYIVNCNFHN